MFLGLDISTSITGFTLLDSQGNLVDIGYCDLKKEKSFFKKGDKLRGELYDFIRNNIGDNLECIKGVYVEESLQMFHSGKSSAKTIAALTAMNKLACWFIYEKLQIEPTPIMATSARKKCGIKNPRGEKAKPIVLQFLLDKEPSVVVESTRTGKPKPYMFDMADSYVVAKAGFLDGSTQKT